MQIAVANAAAETALARPLRIRLDDNLTTHIVVRVVDVHLEVSILVRFDQRKQVLALVQNAVGADDVVGERPETGCLRRRRWMHFLKTSEWS